MILTDASLEKSTEKGRTYPYLQRNLEKSQLFNLSPWKLSSPRALSTGTELSSVAQSCLTLETPWTAARQASLSITNSQSMLKLMPLSRWCHPAISSSVVPFSSCPQSFPASGSFPMSQFVASGGQSTGVSASASVLPMNIQDWSPLG